MLVERLRLWLVLPGHGPLTTIGHERATNPFLLQLQAGAAPEKAG